MYRTDTIPSFNRSDDISILPNGIKFSFISGKYYLGIFSDNLRFLGISFERNFNISLIKRMSRPIKL